VAPTTSLTPPREALDCLRQEVFDDDERAQIAATRQRVAEADLYVVAIGEFKRGKSSLLNALIGRPLLPVGVVPLTAVVTVLRRGPARGTACRDDGAEITVDPLRLADYVTESGNPGNRQGLTRVEVSLPDLSLPDHVAFIDTPGLGSVYETGTDHTLGFLPQIDVALVVLSVDQPLTEAEEQLVARLRDQGAELLFVVNKIDYLTPPELEEALAFVANRLGQAGFMQPPVFATSAKAAAQTERGSGELDGAQAERGSGELDGAQAERSSGELDGAQAERGGRELDGALARPRGQSSGLDKLRQKLAELVETRYESIHAAQATRRVTALLADLETTYAVRAEIAARSEAEVGQALDRLRQSRSEIERLADEQDAIFSHRMKEAERLLGERMRTFQAELQARLLRAVEALADPREQASEKRADELMTAVIAPALSAALHTETPILQAALQEAYERLLAGLDDLADRLARQTAEILAVPIARPQHALRATSAPSVSIKLRDDPVALEILTGALQATLPSPLRRRLVVKRSRERADELANRHAGRLRADLAASLREASRQALRDAHEEINTMSRSIDRAIERGLAQRHLAADEAQSARESVTAALADIRAARDLLAAG
jgi:small GTP-binding protein